MMADKAFIDSNILLRALLPPSGLHQQCDNLIKSLFADAVDIWISGQVIREFLVQVTHPNTTEWPPLSTNAALSRLERFLPSLRVAGETTAVQIELRKLLREYQVMGKSIHDANIIATMLAHGIDTLYTLDGGLGRYAERITVLDADGVAYPTLN